MHDQPTTERAVAVAEDNQKIVTTDHACIDCGYNLRTLAHTGNCPECGTPVSDSLRGDQLIYANANWLKWHHTGWRLLAIAYLISLIIRPITRWAFWLNQPYSSVNWSPFFISRIGSYLYIGILFIATFILTMREPRLNEQPRSGWLRIIRISVVAAISLLLMRFAAAQYFSMAGITNSTPGTSILYMCISLAYQITSGLIVIGLAILFGQTARRMSDLRLMKQSKWVIIGTIITSSMSLLMQVTWNAISLSGSQYNSYNYIPAFFSGASRHIDILVDIYFFIAVVAVCSLLKQIRLQQTLLKSGETQPIPSPQDIQKQPLLQPGSRFMSDKRKGLALLKWAAIFVLMMFNLIENTFFVYTAINILTGIVVIILLFIGSMFVLRKPPKSNNLHDRIPLTSELVGLLAGAGVIGIVCLAINFMQNYNFSGTTSKWLIFVAAVCVTIASLGLLYHFIWLAGFIGQMDLAKKFSRLTIVSGSGLILLLVAILVDLQGLNFYHQMPVMVIIGFLCTAYVLSLWLVTLIDQLWRHFDRPRLTIASDK